MISVAGECRTLRVVRPMRGFARRYWFEIAVVLAAVDAALEVALRQGSANAPHVSAWFAVPALALVILPLITRRHWAFAAPAAVWMLAAAFSFIDGRLVVFTASAYATGMVASFLLGNLKDASQSRPGLLITVGGAATVVYNSPAHTAGDFVFTPALFGMLWLGGLAMQQRGARADAAELQASRLARDRQAATEAAIADERARIARELHDVLGHSLSVMTIQSSAVRRVLPDDLEKERAALLSVEQTGREAMFEMRRLVGILRLPDVDQSLEPQPGFGQLPGLVAQSQGAGLDVEFAVEGEPSLLPPGVDLTVYRVVQEGLTNVRKHSNAKRVAVRVSYLADAVEVEVQDDGRDATPPGETGNGLIGMRERVLIYGGEFQAGPCSDGGYRLRARIPVRS